MFEESCVRLVKAFDNFLKGLGTYVPAAPHLGHVLRHGELGYVFSVHAVVPLLQGKAVIPHVASLGKRRLQNLVVVRLVQFELVGNHTFAFIYDIYAYINIIKFKK